MTREEAKKRLEVWLICGECPEDKQCYDSHLHSTCEYTDYCDEVSLTDAVKVAISALSENNGDLISRQAVLDIWHTRYSDIRVEDEEIKYKKIAYELPSIENKGEWTPVTERLPKNNEIVLCSAISTSISGGITRFVGCCNNGFWFVQTDAETLSYPRQYEVIAWQPLPEPYKAEKGGE